jgi:ABC-type xylose transport system permease subunit
MGVLSGQAIAPETTSVQSLGQTYSVGIAALVISTAVGLVVLIALMILAAMNIRLYRRNKEIEAMDRGNTQELAEFTFKQLSSPGTPGSPAQLTPSTPVNE